VSDEAWQRLTYSLQQPAGVDQALVDDLERMTVELARLERDVTAPMVALNAVTAHLDTLTALLRGSLAPSLRLRLVSLAAEAAALAGWLRWDLGEGDRARHYFRAGLRAAQEAGDGALAAYLVGSLACQPLYLERPTERLSWLADGRAAAAASPHTRAWLLVLEANARAMLGQLSQFQALAGQAEELLLTNDPDDQRRPRVPFFGPDYLAEEEAAGLLRLNLPTEARRTLRAALPRASGRLRLWMVLDLGWVESGSGEPELACRYAMEALDGARVGRIEPILANLRALASDLEPYRHLAEVQAMRETVRLA